jgi:hypothetical protein
MSKSNHSQSTSAGKDGGHKAMGLFLTALSTWAAACTGTPASLPRGSAIRVADYLVMPQTGATDYPSSTANSAYLARVNFLLDEPGGADRFFVNDLNGQLYILDKGTRQLTTYLDFNGRDGQPGMFAKLAFASGYANGLIGFRFDPDYINNGKFYTVHLEDPTVAGSAAPDNTSAPELDVSAYAPTEAISPPGAGARQSVLIEWTDTNPSDATFEGTARELMRVDMNGTIHPMGDLIFNPTATPGSPDWQVMYVAVGDGGAGEQTNSTIRQTPQELDVLNGKILRIIPDLAAHADSSAISPNGRYRIPGDNPFVGLADSGVRTEIYALGLRNPHRMYWDVDPYDAANHNLIVDDIGLDTWEEVDIIHPGANYGYSLREGNQWLQPDNTTAALPVDDVIPLQIDGATAGASMVPTYPVIQYGHGRAGQNTRLAGDAIGGGIVYRGAAIPELYGKYVFADITTGQVLYADYAEMLAADDGDPATLATIHPLDIVWDDPHDSPDRGPASFPTMYPIVREAYHFRGGLYPDLPGNASVAGGRADIRIQVDAAGELYVLSKSDGMIRTIIEP